MAKNNGSSGKMTVLDKRAKPIVCAITSLDEVESWKALNPIRKTYNGIEMRPAFCGQIQTGLEVIVPGNGCGVRIYLKPAAVRDTKSGQYQHEETMKRLKAAIEEYAAAYNR